MASILETKTGMLKSKRCVTVEVQGFATKRALKCGRRDRHTRHMQERIVHMQKWLCCAAAARALLTAACASVFAPHLPTQSINEEV
jgi:hypothetical protein